VPRYGTWQGKASLLMALMARRLPSTLCRERLKSEGLSAEVNVGDMVKLPYDGEFFDAVVDVAAIQHNTPENIAKIFSEIHRVLKTDGHFFSLMRSTRDYLLGYGRQIAENTFTDVPVGDARGTGVILPGVPA